MQCHTCGAPSPQTPTAEKVSPFHSLPLGASYSHFPGPGQCIRTILAHRGAMEEGSEAHGIWRCRAAREQSRMWWVSVQRTSWTVDVLANAPRCRPALRDGARIHVFFSFLFDVSQRICMMRHLYYPHFFSHRIVIFTFVQRKKKFRLVQGPHNGADSDL